ncbi:MAG: uroporphyrinogen-III C-methyltransferase [Deltaproteobacteria bacterium]|nr:uroporphyrinogen-III C-methyltransferase [Deltaproteobacteria bacterium]
MNSAGTEKPLDGRRIVVTRARAQAGILAQRIAELGAEVIECPTIEIQPPGNFLAFDRAVTRIDAYDWLIFTSVNSVGPFLSRLNHVGNSVADLARLKIAAIGSETAKRLEAVGISVTVVPERYQAEGILESLNADEMRGKRVLIPRAAKARDVLPGTLRQWGAHVDVVEAYRTVAPALDMSGIKKRLQLGEVDIVTFASSSTVSNFVQLFAGADLTAIVGNAAVACIGPITAKTVEELGGKVAITAREFTIEGLVKAIVDYFNLTRRIVPAKTPSTPSSEN